MDNPQLYGPYKATKLWNELVDIFRRGVPLKKHRRNIRVYENCFAGLEAVNWFHSVLQRSSYFDNGVSQEQIYQLLNKFLQAGVFCHVSSSDSETSFKIRNLYKLNENFTANTAGPAVPYMVSQDVLSTLPNKWTPAACTLPRNYRGNLQVDCSSINKGLSLNVHNISCMQPHETVQSTCSRVGECSAVVSNDCICSLLNEQNKFGIAHATLKAAEKFNLEVPVLSKINQHDSESWHSESRSPNDVYAVHNLSVSIEPCRGRLCDSACTLPLQKTNLFGNQPQNILQQSSPTDKEVTKQKYGRNIDNICTLTQNGDQPAFIQEKSVHQCIQGSSTKIDVTEPDKYKQPVMDQGFGLRHSVSAETQETDLLFQQEDISQHLPNCLSHSFVVDSAKITYEPVTQPECIVMLQKHEDDYLVNGLSQSEPLAKTESVVFAERYMTDPYLTYSQSHSDGNYVSQKESKPTGQRYVQPGKFLVNKPLKSGHSVSEMYMHKTAIGHNVCGVGLPTNAMLFEKKSGVKNSTARNVASPGTWPNDLKSIQHRRAHSCPSPRDIEVKGPSQYTHSRQSSQCNEENVAAPSSLLREYSRKHDKTRLQAHEVVRSDIPLENRNLDPVPVVDVPGVTQHGKQVVAEAWFTIVGSRLEKLLMGLDVKSLIPKQTPKSWIMENASKIGPRLNLPQHVVNVLTCPEHLFDILPNDMVLEALSYFYGLKNPIIPSELYILFTLVFSHIELEDGAFKGHQRYGENIAKIHENELQKHVSTLRTKINNKPRSINGRKILENVLPPNSCYETAFTSNSPTTRIIARSSIDQQNAHFGSLLSQGNSKQVLLNVGMRNDGLKKQTFQPSRKVKNNFKHRPLSEGTWSHIRNKSGGYVNPLLSHSSDDIMACVNQERLNYSAALDSMLRNLVEHTRKSVKAHRSSPVGSKEYSGSLQNQEVQDNSQLYHDSAASTVMTSEAENLAISAYQLALLYLPPQNRIQLNLLLGFLHKFVNFYDSSDVAALHHNVLEDMAPSILKPQWLKDYDRKLILSIVKFLVKHCDRVFIPPSNTESDVQRYIMNLHREQVITYCKQVSSQQFEQQRLTGSQLALSELLDHILSDRKMSNKEKKKRLRVFKESYPQIYHNRFPTDSASDKPRTRSALNIGALKFKNLRV